MVDAAVSKTVEVTLVRVRLSPSAPSLFIPEKTLMHSNYPFESILKISPFAGALASLGSSILDLTDLDNLFQEFLSDQKHN